MNDQFVLATNEIFRLLNAHPEPTDDDLQTIFRIGCRTLERVLEDEEFSQALETLKQRATQNADEVRETIKNASRFAYQFLTIERDVLMNAGFEAVTWGRLVATADAVRSDLSPSSMDRDHVLQILQNLHSAVCRIHGDLEDSRRREDGRRNARRMFGKLCWGIGGITLIYADAAAAAATFGLSASMSAVSGAVGCKMVDKGSD